MLAQLPRTSVSDFKSAVLDPTKVPLWINIFVVVSVSPNANALFGIYLCYLAAHVYSSDHCFKILISYAAFAFLTQSQFRSHPNDDESSILRIPKGLHVCFDPRSKWIETVIFFDWNYNFDHQSLPDAHIDVNIVRLCHEPMQPEQVRGNAFHFVILENQFQLVLLRCSLLIWLVQQSFYKPLFWKIARNIFFHASMVRRKTRTTTNHGKISFLVHVWRLHKEVIYFQSFLELLSYSKQTITRWSNILYSSKTIFTLLRLEIEIALCEMRIEVWNTFVFVFHFYSIRMVGIRSLWMWRLKWCGRKEPKFFIGRSGD